MTAKPKWPAQLKTLASSYSDARVRFGNRVDTLESELWILLQTVLGGFLIHEIRNPEIRNDELPGLAADKTAELIDQIRQGRWHPGDEDEGRIYGYMKQVAHNAAKAFWRKYYRERGGEQLMEIMDTERDPSPLNPEIGAAGREMAKKLHGWLQQFKPLHAHIFVMKAFYQMRSREIARHPTIRTSATNVDTVWDRMRKELRRLLDEEESGPERFPPGTFSTFLLLWESGGPKAGVIPGEA